MKRMPSVVMLVCTTLGTLPAAAGTPSAAAAIPVYDSTEIAYDRYTVIRRLGVEGRPADGRQHSVFAPEFKNGRSRVGSLHMFLKLLCRERIHRGVGVRRELDQSDGAILFEIHARWDRHQYRVRAAPQQCQKP